MSRFKAIIFDFDGIIAESLDVKTQAFAEIYKPYGEDVVKKVVAHHESNGGVSRFEKFRIYHKEFVNREINETEVAELARRFSELVLEKVSEAPSVKGAEEFIKDYHDRYIFFIATGTPTDEIEIILRNRGIRQFFKGVFGSPEKKTEHVKKILTENSFSPSEVVFLGDATADRDAANENGLTFIGRFTTSEEIKKEKFQINDLTNLQQYLESL